MLTGTAAVRRGKRHRRAGAHHRTGTRLPRASRQRPPNNSPPAAPVPREGSPPAPARHRRGPPRHRRGARGAGGRCRGGCVRTPGPRAGDLGRCARRHCDRRRRDRVVCAARAAGGGGPLRNPGSTDALGQRDWHLARRPARGLLGGDRHRRSGTLGPRPECGAVARAARHRGRDRRPGVAKLVARRTLGRVLSGRRTQKDRRRRRSLADDRQGYRRPDGRRRLEPRRRDRLRDEQPWTATGGRSGRRSDTGQRARQHTRRGLPRRPVLPSGSAPLSLPGVERDTGPKTGRSTSGR